MRRDKNDTRGRIPPEQRSYVIMGGNSAGKTTEQNWALIEAKVYDALWTLKTIHLAHSGTGAYERISLLLGKITPIEQTAMTIYGHWIVYGWDVAKPMVRELYPDIVNKHISSTISGIGDM